MQESKCLPGFDSIRCAFFPFSPHQASDHDRCGRRGAAAGALGGVATQVRPPGIFAGRSLGPVFGRRRRRYPDFFNSRIVPGDHSFHRPAGDGGGRGRHRVVGSHACSLRPHARPEPHPVVGAGDLCSPGAAVPRREPFHRALHVLLRPQWSRGGHSRRDLRRR